MRILLCKIIVKHKKVYDTMKNSKHVGPWRWMSGHSLAEWSPYDIPDGVKEDTPIVIYVHSGLRISYINALKYPEKASGAWPWAQWCELFNKERRYHVQISTRD